MGFEWPVNITPDNPCTLWDCPVRALDSEPIPYCGSMVIEKNLMRVSIILQIQKDKR